VLIHLRAHYLLLLIAALVVLFSGLAVWFAMRFPPTALFSASLLRPMTRRYCELSGGCPFGLGRER
jgi:hypothetical protein